LREITPSVRSVCFTGRHVQRRPRRGVANAQARTESCGKPRCRNGANAGLPGPPATNASTTEGPDQWFGLSAYEFVECDRQPPAELVDVPDHVRLLLPAWGRGDGLGDQPLVVLGRRR